MVDLLRLAAEVGLSGLRVGIQLPHVLLSQLWLPVEPEPLLVELDFRRGLDSIGHVEDLSREHRLLFTQSLLLHLHAQLAARAQFTVGVYSAVSSDRLSEFRVSD